MPSNGKDKAANFRRLAEARVSKTIGGIRQIGKLSTSAYEYRPEQITKMFKTLRAEMDDAENRFRGKASSEEKFSFD